METESTGGALEQLAAEALKPGELFNPNSTEQRDPETGRFVPGNMSHGTHFLTADAERLPVALQQVLAHEADYIGRRASDFGGESELSEGQRELMKLAAAAHRRAAQIDVILQCKGLMDPKGRLRTEWLKAHMGYSNTARAIEMALGISRRTKQALTVAEYMASYTEEKE